MDYSKTVNLPKTDFPMKADLPKREPEMLAQWAKEKVYEKALEKRKGKPPFILHDGPPYANGHLHLGHALNKILKDIIVRAKTMAGFYSPYVPGWDCHGLPIELALMKELKITDKHQVDREKFRAQAGAFAQKFVDIQREEFKRMGVLGEWDHPYLTMAPAFKEMIVNSFKALEKKGFVYRGKKPVYWCSTDETALAEAEVEYENDKGPSIFVAFPHASKAHEFFVIWTTTPWTLPANVAIAVHPEESYVGLKVASGQTYVVAQKRLESFQVASKLEGQVVAQYKGADLAQESAQHPWITNRLVKVLAANFVAMDTGTGLVHIAPGHGREDFIVGQKNDLPVISPVTDRGLFTDEVPEWKGEHVFKANTKIIDFLKEKGALLYSGEIEHSYPHCWRCHKPVIFRATEQWFLDIDKAGDGGKTLRERLREVIDHDVKWIPAYGQNRITGMVESRPDWCLSRQRLWGTEIPSDVRRLPAGQAGPTSDLGPRTPDPDIFDVWFESGVSWAAVLQNHKEWPELSYPADMYLEGSDQHRGWFQVSLIPSVALESKAPFKAVLTHGFVMDGEGRPMSKSLGNVISPEQIIKQYGADVLRLWVAASDYGGDVRLSQDILKNQADAYRKVRNTFRYLLNNISDFDPARNAVPYKELPEIDRWALHRLQEEIRDARASYDDYQFNRVVSRLVNFCGVDLSSFYLDVIKDRLYCDPVDSLSRRAAQTVLYRIADSLVRMLAPILSFTMDECWRFLGHTDSVNQADLPSEDAALKDDVLFGKWKAILALRETLLGEMEKARAAGRIKAAREARVSIRFEKTDQYEFFKGYAPQLATIFGISRVELSNDSSVDSIAVDVQMAEGAKCARCWIYKSDIGKNAAYADICERCADAIGQQVAS